MVATNALREVNFKWVYINDFTSMLLTIPNIMKLGLMKSPKTYPFLSEGDLKGAGRGPDPLLYLGNIWLPIVGITEA